MFEDFIDELLFSIELNKKKILLSILLLLIISPSFFYIYANYGTQNSKVNSKEIEINTPKIDRNTRNKKSEKINESIAQSNKNVLA
jgi:uncharacterized protein YxeA